MKFSLLVVVATVAAVASAACTLKTVTVQNGDELRSALKTVTAGTTIVLTHGVTYSLAKDMLFQMSAYGEEDCPIVITTDDLGPSLDDYATIANFFYVISSSYVVFANVSFSVEGTAVYCTGKNLLFENVVFSTKKTSTSAGIGVALLSDSTGITFRKCVFVNNDGIAAVLSQGVSHVAFGECNFTNNTRDVSADRCSDVSITESLFVGRPVLQLEKVSQMVIRDNLFMRTDDSFWNIIYLQFFADAQGIRNNFFVKDKGYAMICSGCTCKVCASNKVIGGAQLTPDNVDYSC